MQLATAVVSVRTEREGHTGIMQHNGNGGDRRAALELIFTAGLFVVAVVELVVQIVR